jgi:hypothetical protein
MTPREELALREELAHREAIAAQPVTEKGSWFDPLMQGLTMGRADELGYYGARLGASLAGAPSERVAAAGPREKQRQRDRLANYREENFLPAMALEAGGAMVTGAPLFKGLQMAGQGLRMGPIATNIAAGGIEGGIAGSGAADEDKLLGAGIGAGLGSGFAAGMPLIGAATKFAAGMPLIGAATKFAGEKMLPYLRKAFEGSSSTAGRVLSESLQQAGQTPTLLRARQRQLGPQATLADISGPGGQGLAQGVVQADLTGQSVANARRELSKRAAGSTRRIQADLEGATGINQRLQPTLDAVRARQKAAAEPAYQLAYDSDISLTPKLKNILARPPMQKAWGEARDAAATRGEELPPFLKLDEFGDWQKSGVMPDMRAWDRMKQGVDRMIEGETDAITGRVTPKGRDLSMLKKELVSELDEINPTYKAARQAFAGDEAIQNAMREGERFLNMKTRQVTSAVGDMTDSEKEAFLTGAMESIREKMGRARAGEIGEFKFLETGNVKDKLRSIFPEGRAGDRQLAEVFRTLDRERTFATTQGLVTGGSQTALRQAAGQALKSGAGMPTSIEMLTNPLRGGMQAALQGASQAMSGIGQKPIAELGKMFFDPDQVSRAIAEMQLRGIKPADLQGLMGRYSAGGARLAPLLGLSAGEMTNQ